MIDFSPFIESIADAVVNRLRSTNTGLRPRLLTVAQAAIYLGRSEDSIRSLHASGRLPAVKLDARVQFDIRDLDRYIEAAKN